MTADDWKKAEEILNEYYLAELLIDGYHVQLMLVRIEMHFEIAVYVNRKMRAEWIFKDCEERRRFMCESTHSLVGRYDKKKGLSKREYNRLKKEHTYSCYSPYFKSFKTLKSQFIKHNKSIELDKKYKEETYND